jgi:hypothetical protein
MRKITPKERSDAYYEMRARPSDLDLPDLLLDDPIVAKQVMSLALSSMTDWTIADIPSSQEMLEIARATSKVGTPRR